MQLLPLQEPQNPVALENAIGLGPNKILHDIVNLAPDFEFNLAGAQLSVMS